MRSGFTLFFEMLYALPMDRYVIIPLAYQIPKPVLKSQVLILDSNYSLFPPHLGCRFGMGNWPQRKTLKKCIRWVKTRSESKGSTQQGRHSRVLGQNKALAPECEPVCREQGQGWECRGTRQPTSHPTTDSACRVGLLLFTSTLPQDCSKVPLSPHSTPHSTPAHSR